MYPDCPEGTQVIVGFMNMGYISDTTKNRTQNLFRPKRELILLGHSDGHCQFKLMMISLARTTNENKHGEFNPGEKRSNEWQEFVCELLEDPRWNWIKFLEYARCITN